MLEHDSGTNRECRIHGMRSFFDASEIDLLLSASAKVDANTATVVYCVYENPFARSGGIYAVAVNYAATLRASGRDTLVVSPFHSRVSSAPKEPLTCIGSCEVPFGENRVAVKIFEYFQEDVRWILFGSVGFFDASGGEAGGDPYVHEDPGKLLIDSLFASAAIPYVLAELGKTNNVIVHAQDWQLAGTALTAKLAVLENRLRSVAVVLTCHNPYDQGLSSTELSLMTSRQFTGNRFTETVYQYFMPLVDAPITTVSRVFANDLVSDPLQTSHFAKHLQVIFQKRGVIGVDNGLFLPPIRPFHEKSIAEAMAGRPQEILKEKDELRRKMLAELDSYTDPRIFGKLAGVDGKPLRDLPPEIPVYVMFGRLDPGQKGFDVLARAIEAMPRGKSRFILTPIVPKESPFSDDLRQLALRCSGDVAVYPFRMEKGYLETMAGATFAVLPSLYEPFGAATEPYLTGTPVIGRATGGLCQQVVSFGANADEATGFLYRELLPDAKEESIQADWREIQRAKTPGTRYCVPVYGAMVATLATTLSRSAELYRFDKPAYGKMLGNLFKQATSFGWDRALREYLEVYKLATD